MKQIHIFIYSKEELQVEKYKQKKSKGFLFVLSTC